MNRTERAGTMTGSSFRLPKKSTIDFHVRKGLFGYEVTPPGGELWFGGSDCPKIKIHNRTGALIYAEVVEEKVKEKMTRPSDQSGSEAEVASLEFAQHAKPEVAEFRVLIWCEPCDGVVFRAQACSDPRVRVLP